MKKVISHTVIIGALSLFLACPASGADPEIWPQDRFEFLMDYGSLSVEAELCKTTWSKDIHPDWLQAAARSRTSLGMSLRDISDGLAAGKQLTGKFYRDHPDMLDCKRTQTQMRLYEEFLYSGQ